MGNAIKPGTKMYGFDVGFIYLIALGDHQKIGRSSNVDGVLASARRFDASARLVVCWPGPNCAEHEKEIHEGLKIFRVQNEQFKLPADALRWVAALDDREFGAWSTEAFCDARSIGWEFPRIYLGGEKRMWTCAYFPESDRVAWGLVASDKKPDYSLIEKAWEQNPRAFNSAWLGRPEKLRAMSAVSSLPQSSGV
jgi:hypothetical protein